MIDLKLIISLLEKLNNSLEEYPVRSGTVFGTPEDFMINISSEDKAALESAIIEFHNILGD